MPHWGWGSCCPPAGGEVSCVVVTELTGRKAALSREVPDATRGEVAGWPLRKKGRREEKRKSRKDTEKEGDSPAMRHPSPFLPRDSPAPSADEAYRCATRQGLGTAVT